jgi:hypothetical protein
MLVLAKTFRNWAKLKPRNVWTKERAAFSNMTTVLSTYNVGIARRVVASDPRMAPNY